MDMYAVRPCAERGAYLLHVWVGKPKDRSANMTVLNNSTRDDVGGRKTFDVVLIFDYDHPVLNTLGKRATHNMEKMFVVADKDNITLRVGVIIVRGYGKDVSLDPENDEELPLRCLDLTEDIEKVARFLDFHRGNGHLRHCKTRFILGNPAIFTNMAPPKRLLMPIPNWKTDQ